MYVINNDSDGAKHADNNTDITEISKPPATNNGGTAGGNENTPTDDPTPPTPTQAPTTVTFGSKVGKADQYEIGPIGVAHKVEIKISGGRSWLEVRAKNNTGEKLYSANAEDGSVETFDLTGPLYINVGRSDLTVITVDGVIVPDGDRAGSKKLLLHPIIDENATTDGSTDTNTSTGNETDQTKTE